MEAHIPLILEDGGNGLTPFFRQLLSSLYNELMHLDVRVENDDKQIEIVANRNKQANRLQTIPGIGQ